MKQFIVITISIFIILLVAYFFWKGLGDIAYGDKWKYRTLSTRIKESKSRGVFVKELRYKFDSFTGPSFKFEAFIEKGFKVGQHSVNETVPLVLSDTKYLYQLSFDYGILDFKDTIGRLNTQNTMNSINIRKNQLNKFDSSNGYWGYLQKPDLKDTITLEIKHNAKLSGIIKVWQ